MIFLVSASFIMSTTFLFFVLEVFCYHPLNKLSVFILHTLTIDGVHVASWNSFISVLLRSNIHFPKYNVVFSHLYSKLRLQKWVPIFKVLLHHGLDILISAYHQLLWLQIFSLVFLKTLLFIILSQTYTLQPPLAWSLTI